MKVRNGFVSNSSSSSFLVAFPRNPKDAADLQKMVFADDTRFVHPYGDSEHYPNDYPISTIVDIIWNDIRKQIPNNKKIILSKMHNVIIDRMDDYEIGDWEHDWERYTADNNAEVKKFIEEHQGCFFYCFTYADDEGSLGCAMEHGGLFRRLPHLRSSNH